MKNHIYKILLIAALIPNTLYTGWKDFFDAAFGMHSEEDVESVYQTTTSTVAFNTTPTESTLLKAVQRRDTQFFINSIENGFYSAQNYNNVYAPPSIEKKCAVLAIKNNLPEIFNYLEKRHPNLILNSDVTLYYENPYRQEAYNKLATWALHQHGTLSERYLLFALRNKDYSKEYSLDIISLLHNAVRDDPLESDIFITMHALEGSSWGSIGTHNSINCIFYKLGFSSLVGKLPTQETIAQTVLSAMGAENTSHIDLELKINYHADVQELKTTFYDISTKALEKIEEYQLVYKSISYLFFYMFRNACKQHVASVQNIKKDIFDLYNHLLRIFPKETESFLHNDVLFEKIVGIVMKKMKNPFGQEFSLTKELQPFCIKKLIQNRPCTMVSIVCLR